MGMLVGISLNVVMTAVGFGVSILFIVFVCTRLLCARIHRRRSNNNNHSPSSSAAHYLIQVDRGVRGGGLEPSTVAAFPTHNFARPSPQLGDATTQCIVCLAEYQEKDVLRVLPYCGHNFHVSCIDMWLKQHSTCPVCRISLRDSPDGNRAMPTMPSTAIRSPYSPQTVGSDPCHCLFAGPGHSTRTTEIRRNESDEADQIVSGPSVHREDNFTLSEDNCSGGNDNCNRTVGKHMDSPSYS